MLNIINLILNIFNYYQKTLKIVDEFFLSIEKEIFLFIEKNFRVLTLILVSILYLVCLGLMISYDYSTMSRIIELQEDLNSLYIQLRQSEAYHTSLAMEIQDHVFVIRTIKITNLDSIALTYIKTLVILRNFGYKVLSRYWFGSTIDYQENFSQRMQEYIKNFPDIPPFFNLKTKAATERFIKYAINLDQLLKYFRMYFFDRDLRKLDPENIAIQKCIKIMLLNNEKYIDLQILFFDKKDELEELLNIVEVLSVVWL